MDAQEDNLCLLNMPELVLENILSNIHNPSNVSRTCKYLYEIVFGMEKERRVLHITAFDAPSPLNIDADAVFDSIINSHRTITKIEVHLNRSAVEIASSYELTERQLERILAIMKRFGSNVTSLKFYGFVLPISFILELLQLGSKLESLSFAWGKVMGSLPKNTTMSLQLSSLKALEIIQFPGLLDMVNLIPAGKLNFVRYTNETSESTEVFATILTKQHNINSLTLDVHLNFDITSLCIDHLELETLILKFWLSGTNIQFEEILKCQMNLKKLRFSNYQSRISGSSFQWICNNLRKLEVFEVIWVDSIVGNAFEMLSNLTKLRHFRTSDGNNLFVNGFQSFQFKSDSIEKFEFGFRPRFRCGKLLTKMVNSMAHNLPNLTHLNMRFENFSALCFVLRHCTQIIHLSSYIRDSIPDQLDQQRFPNILTLELFDCDEMMIQSVTTIVRAMPNLKRVSIRSGLKFDVKTMKEFVKEIKSLEYFYVDRFVLHRDLSTDDVVETIRRLTNQLKGYHIIFSSYTSAEDLSWHKLKDILSIDFYARDDCCSRIAKRFYLHKGMDK